MNTSLSKERFRPKTSPFVIRHSSSVILSLAILASSSLVCPASEPLRALLVTGGCCHDYEAQKKILTEGISARANVTWTIIHEGDSNSRTQEFSIYKKPDWTKGFDVVVHNECSGFVTNVDWVEHIAKGHADGVPAVVIHCSIHSYRNSTTDEWRKLLGVSSYRHQALRPFQVETIKPEHPIMKGFPVKWQDGPDELYEIKKVWPDCTPLAEAITPGKESDRHPVVWVNKYGKARVFGTTVGHSNDIMSRPEYLDLVTRGLLWACGKLDER
jgi:type 1 glutamine amidotransferase